MLKAQTRNVYLLGSLSWYGAPHESYAIDPFAMSTTGRSRALSSAVSVGGTGSAISSSGEEKMIVQSKCETLPLFTSSVKGAYVVGYRMLGSMAFSKRDLEVCKCAAGSESLVNETSASCAPASAVIATTTSPLDMLS